MSYHFALGAVDGAQVTNALNQFRANYPGAMSEVAMAAARLKQSSDPSNVAEGQRWETSLIPQLQRWASKILAGDFTSAQSFADTISRLIAAANAWVGADKAFSERLVLALQEIVRTTATAAKNVVKETARATGETLNELGAGAGVSNTSVLSLGALLLAGAAFVYILKK